MKIKTVGIYKIENLHNGRVYIGVSVNVERRFYQHKNLLLNGKHPNKGMQQDYLASGSDAVDSVFSFIQLSEGISVKDVDEVEAIYIKKYASSGETYNRKAASPYGYSDKKQREKNHAAIKALGRKWTIEECRLNCGLTVESMAKKMHVSVPKYEYIEKFGHFDHPSTIYYFLKLVDVESEYFEHIYKP